MGWLWVVTRIRVAMRGHQLGRGDFEVIKEPHLSYSLFPPSPPWPVLLISPMTPPNPTPSHSSSSFWSCCACRPHTHILSGATCKRGKKKRKKNFIRYFPEERGLHPLNLCHMATEEDQPWGPLTNSEAPSPLAYRANPVGTTFANASIQQHSPLTDKTSHRASFSYPFGSTSREPHSLVLIFIP